MRAWKDTSPCLITLPAAAVDRGQDAAAFVGEIVAEERVAVLMRDTTGSFVVRRRFPSARS